MGVHCQFDNLSKNNFGLTSTSSSWHTSTYVNKYNSLQKNDKLKEKLEGHNYKIHAYTGSLISTEKNCKINIYSSGKTIIKTRNHQLVEKLSKELSNILYPKEQGNIE